MRLPRQLGALIAVLTTIALSVLPAPTAVADPPFRVPGYVTDHAQALKNPTRVRGAVDELYQKHHVRLWVVYVHDFNGADPDAWARKTMQASSFGSRDALFAVATDERAYAFEVPSGVENVTDSEIEALRANSIEPALRSTAWDDAAVRAADGLDTAISSTRTFPWKPVLVVFTIGLAIIAAAMLFSSLRRRARRQAEVEIAKQIDPTDAAALASQSVDALDGLSRSIVVNVDNALRTSDAELALAVEEFGADQTAPFREAVESAKAALKQAFSVRKQLDDAIPETPDERRRMLIALITSAAKADKVLEDQSSAFDALRNLVLGAPDRLDALTQQLVAVTARIPESERILAQLHTQFDGSALASVADNVKDATDRVKFADGRITHGRELVGRPVQGEQMNLVDAIRGAESALTQANQLLDAVDNAANDIRHATETLSSSIADTRTRIAQAEELQQQTKVPTVPASDDLAAAHAAASAAVAEAERLAPTDPLTAYTHLCKADAELHKALATVAQEEAEAQRRAQLLDRAIGNAATRVATVSQYVSVHRGAIGERPRTLLAEAQNKVDSARAKRDSDPADALLTAGRATELAVLAQQAASRDVGQARAYYDNGYYYGSGYSPTGDAAGSVAGAVLGGLLRGFLISGGGRSGSWSSGSRSSSYGGSSRSSGISYRGGGGRF